MSACKSLSRAELANFVGMNADRTLRRVSLPIVQRARKMSVPSFQGVSDTKLPIVAALDEKLSHRCATIDNRQINDEYSKSFPRTVSSTSKISDTYLPIASSI